MHTSAGTGAGTCTPTAPVTPNTNTHPLHLHINELLLHHGVCLDLCVCVCMGGWVGVFHENRSNDTNTKVMHAVPEHEDHHLRVRVRFFVYLLLRTCRLDIEHVHTRARTHTRSVS